MKKKNLSIFNCLPAILLALITVGCQPDSGPDVDATWSDWIKANHYPLRSLDTDDNDYNDLQFFKPLLSGRRLLGLGENGHGVAEFSRAKVRLIKFLHEEMVFDVIAFESSIFECYQADSHAVDWTAEAMMGRSIFQVWHTEDVLELFRYIRESKKTSRPLILAGFDNQNSTLACLRRPAAFQSAIAKIDPDYADEVQRLDLDFLKMTFSADWQAALVEPYRLFYDNLWQWFDAHMEELIALHPRAPLLPLVLRQSAWSQRTDIDAMITPYEQGGFNFRDRAMADNVGVLLEKLYPDKKIMLWAHNGHLDHNFNLTGEVNWEMFSMGYWLSQRHRPLLYTIEFFMFQGAAAETNRSVYQIAPAPAGTLEAVLFQTGAEFAFADMLNQSENPGNSWMFSTINWMNSGIWATPMIPRRQFDGIFYVKTVNPPPYVRYYESPD